MLGLFGANLSWGIYPVIFVLGVGGIGFGGVYLTLLSELGGRGGAAKAAGFGSTIGVGGSVLGPPVFGYIVDATGSYNAAWLLQAFMAALCVLLLNFVREEKRKI
jgi:cyanate permease